MLRNISYGQVGSKIASFIDLCTYPMENYYVFNNLF